MNGGQTLMSMLRKLFIPANANPDDVRMTLGEHLEELRSRLIRALVGLFVGAVVAYSFIGYIQAFLIWPVFTIYKKHGFDAKVSTLGPSEGFMTDFKVAIIVGLIVSAPYSIMQIWGFIAAGLYPHERKWVRGFAPVSIILFFAGALFLIVVVNPLLLDFLLTYRTELPDVTAIMPTNLVKSSEPPLLPVGAGAATPASQPGTGTLLVFDNDPPSVQEGVPWVNRAEREIRIRFAGKTYAFAHLREAGVGNRIEPDIRFAEIVPFTLELAAAFGIGFQVPVVVAFIATLGIMTAAQMAQFRRHVIFVMAIGAAVITPSPDPFSMMMLLGPMVGLFEAGLFAARTIERKRQSREAGTSAS
jgi:sec-independent protein translocase protein TatC